MLPDDAEQRNLPWFRFYTEFATDPDVQSLAFEDQRHYVVLLCLKGSGVLDRQYPTPERRAQVIARALGLDQVAGAEALRRLTEAGLLDPGGGPRGWTRRQTRTDKSAERTAKWRARNVTRHGDVTVTAPDVDLDLESETESKAHGRPCGYVDKSGDNPSPAAPSALSQATGPQNPPGRLPAAYSVAIERGLSSVPRIPERALRTIVGAVKHVVRGRPDLPPEAVTDAVAQFARAIGFGGADPWPYLVATIPLKADALVEDRLEREAEARRAELARERRTA